MERAGVHVVYGLLGLKIHCKAAIVLRREGDAIRPYLHLATGNLSAASRLGDELHPNANRVVSLREQELALLARLRLAQGRPDEAVNILEPFVQDGLGPHASGHLSILLEIMALQVRALDVQGSHEAALELLLKALALAEPEGFVRVFVDQGAHMGLLIADCRLRIEDRRMSLDEGLRAQLLSYTTRLLAAFPASPPLTTTRAPLPTLLTERELEVLRLIAANRKFMKAYVVMRALVNNPRAPIDITMPLLIRIT